MSGDDLPGVNEADGQAEEVLDQIQPALAFESADGDELEREAGLRHDRLFEAALGADEDDFARRVAREELPRNGDGRVDVAPGATTRDHQSLHALHAHPVAL